MKRICVYCGSGRGENPIYTTAARELGNLLVREGLGLVYGGGRIGLMNEIAETVLAGGGEVTGVIPQVLVDKEVAHTGLSDLRIVNTMHERKALMAELADSFIAMPGGLGTLDEFFEVLTWGQLGLHRKPCGLFNVNGFYDHLLDMLDYMTGEKVHPAGNSRDGAGRP